MYNNTYQDGVIVSISGGGSDTTKNGGYYNLSITPNIGVLVSASYNESTQSKSTTAGAAGSSTTLDFDLKAPEAATPSPGSSGAYNSMIVGVVMYNNQPVVGIMVDASPYGTTTTDSTGHYRINVPSGKNLTISTGMAGGSDSKSIVTPANGGGMAVILNISAAGASPAATAVPTDSVAKPTANATNTSATNLSATVTPVTTTPTVSTNGTSANVTSTAAGSESLVIWTTIGLLSSILLIRRRKE
ncbi:MAG TPA: hypothetical protein VK436_00760 [Methanocella sp.]|nr:hypothetical protein [Methanocella sp.]